MSVCACMASWVFITCICVSLKCVVGSTDIHSQLGEILEGILSFSNAAGLNQLNIILLRIDGVTATLYPPLSLCRHLS